jgi:uncharacterized protein (DUF433 family)
MAIEIAPRVVVDPAVCGGKPVIRGTRVPVALVIGKLAGGLSFEELMAEYALTEADIRAALAYAAQVLSAEEVRATA